MITKNKNSKNSKSKQKPKNINLNSKQNQNINLIISISNNDNPYESFKWPIILLFLTMAFFIWIYNSIFLNVLIYIFPAISTLIILLMTKELDKQIKSSKRSILYFCIFYAASTIGFGNEYVKSTIAKNKKSLKASNEKYFDLPNTSDDCFLALSANNPKYLLTQLENDINRMMNPINMKASLKTDIMNNLFSIFDYYKITQKQIDSLNYIYRDKDE